MDDPITVKLVDCIFFLITSGTVVKVGGDANPELETPQRDAGNLAAPTGMKRNNPSLSIQLPVTNTGASGNANSNTVSIENAIKPKTVCICFI